MNKINVLLVNDHLGWNDGKLHGVGKWFLNLIPAFDKRPFNLIPLILRKDQGADLFFQERGITVRHLDRTKYDPLTLLDIMKIIKKEDIKLIHAQGFGSAAFGRLAGEITGTPVIIHVHSFYPYIPLSVRFTDILLQHSFDKAIAVSGSVKKFCIEKEKFSDTKVDVLCCGINTKELKQSSPEKIKQLRNTFHIPAGYKLIGTVTRLYQQKGNVYLVMAAAEILKKHPSTIFMFIGDGPLKLELQQQSIDLKIEKNVIFTGFMDNIPEIISAIDIAVFPSLWEGTPLAALECMWMGKPIVATNVDGLGEVLTNNENALLVPPADPNLLAEKIMFLLENKSAALMLAENARKKSTEYTIEAHSDKLETIYRNVMEKHWGREENFL